MINKFLDWLFPSSDWRLVEVIQGEWTITNYGYGNPYKSAETSVYEIYYSQSKNDYQLQVSGYKPKEHDKYVIAVKKLNELKNTK
jgi:hypothetical protein